MFEASLVNDTARTARPYTVSFSALLQVLAALGAVTYPLWHIEPLPRIPLRAPSPFRNAIRLVDPTPANASQPAARTSNPNALTVPQVRRFISIERRSADTTAAVTGPEIDIAGLSIGPNSDPAGPFIPGGIPGTGTGGGVIAVPAPRSQEPVKPPATKVTGPVRPGGNVRPPQLLREVKPAYPALARQARVQGTVRIEAIISREGIIRDARVVGGHPLLIAAALDAVRQWQYRPTSLNGEPVEVALALEVNFKLSQ